MNGILYGDGLAAGDAAREDKICGVLRWTFHRSVINMEEIQNMPTTETDWP
jgi:hypothetical protein